MNLSRLLKPKAIALVGASPDLGKISGRPLYYLLKHGYPGELYVVNPKYHEIRGVACYPTVDSLPREDIDLALITLPVNLVSESVEQCALKGIGAAVVYASGYSEMGKQGRQAQSEIGAIARQHGMCLLGPNCQGFINVRDRVAASFSRVLDAPNLKPGPVALVTQSGAFGGSILNAAQEAGVGVAYWVNTGNEVAIDALDVASYVLDDPEVSIVALYLESIRNGRKIFGLSDKAKSRRKPIIAVCAGKTAAGSRAALSHTAAMTTSGRLFDEACKQFGIISVEDLEELIDAIQVFLGNRGTTAAGKRTLVFTTSGGAGALVADKCSDLGLEVPVLNQTTQARLATILPPFAAVSNPVDVTAQVTRTLDSADEELASIFGNALETALFDDRVDCCVVLLTMIEGRRAVTAAKQIVCAAESCRKPVTVAWLAGKMGESGYEILRSASTPLYHSPLRAVKAMQHLLSFSEFLKRTHDERGLVHPGSQAREGRKLVRVTEWEAKRYLRRHGIPIPESGLARSCDEALEVARKVGYPVVLKFQSPKVAHKTDVGGISLGIKDDQGLVREIHAMTSRMQAQGLLEGSEGFMIEEMISESDGAEAIVGVIRDPCFGHVLVFGLGGIFVEVLNDVSYRIIPISRYDAESMVREIAGYKVLLGMRGRPRLDIEALIETLILVSDLVSKHGDGVQELEINPLLVLPEGKGVIALDAIGVMEE